MWLNGRASRVVLTASLAFTTIAFAQDREPEAVPGEYVVRLKKGVNKMHSPQKISQILRAEVKAEFPALNIIVVKKSPLETMSSAVSTMSVSDVVDIVEPNYIYHASRTANDPMMSQLWGFKNKGQKDSENRVGVSGVDINIEKAWDITTGSKKVLVAIIDTGIDFKHPDLKDNLWTNEAEAKGKPGVDDDRNGVIDDIHGYNAITGKGDAQDDHGHGSHCAGTIGAKGNDKKGIAGVNWDVQMMAVKFLDKTGAGTLEGSIKAVAYATKMGAQVLSNSWGGGDFSQILKDTIEASNKAGTIFIAAAGNEGLNTDLAPSYPAGYDVANIISVAAINNQGALADFSNYGNTSVDIAAPGVNIYSSTGGSYKSWSGTSMATPHVSGVAALVWANEPQLTALQLKERLLKTASPLKGLRNKVKTGAMLNAYSAVTNTTPAPDPNDPINWQTTAVNYASASPYLPETDQTIEIKLAGVKDIALFFEKIQTEQDYDTVKLVDVTGKTVQILSGFNQEFFSEPIRGSSVKVVFNSDKVVEMSGWKITKIAFRK